MNRRLLGQALLMPSAVFLSDCIRCVCLHFLHCAKCDDALNPGCFRADVFQSVELPETIEEFLVDGVAQCIAFNRRGTLLAGKLARVGHCAIRDCCTLHYHLGSVAAGRVDGGVVIWDTETRGVAQRYKPHR